MSKAAATLVAQFYSARLSITILRLFSIYGPGEQEPRLVPYVISRARQGRPIEITAGEQIRDYVYVGDAAEAFWRALVTGHSPGQLRILNVASGCAIKLRAFVETLSEVLRNRGLKPDLRFGAKPYRSDELMHYTANVDLLRETLRWVPSTPLSIGLSKMTEKCLQE